MAKIIQGKIVSTKMQGTVSVQVERAFRHKLYKKTIVRHKKYLADVGNVVVQEGDVVKMQECRPLSKNKHFILVEKVAK